MLYNELLEKEDIFCGIEKDTTWVYYRINEKWYIKDIKFYNSKLDYVKIGSQTDPEYSFDFWISLNELKERCKSRTKARNEKLYNILNSIK